MSLVLLTAGGSMSLTLYFAITYLLIGNPAKKWMAWVGIALTPFVVAISLLILGYFY